MGKDIDRLKNFQKILTFNYMALMNFSDDSNVLQEQIQKMDEELSHLQEQWRMCEDFMMKKFILKLRYSARLQKEEKIKKLATQQSNIKDRTFVVVKRFIEPLCSNFKKYRINTIELIDVYFYLLKYKKNHITIIYPNQQAFLKNSKFENTIENSPYSKLQQRVYFNISLINLFSGTVLNMNFYTDCSENLEQKFQSKNFEVVMGSFSLHYIFESERNFSLKDIYRNHKVNINSDKNIDLLEKKLQESFQISLQLKCSEYDYYNQMTMGMRKKMEEYNYVKSSRIYFTKFIEHAYRYLQIGLENKNLFCQGCKKFMLMNSDKKIEYPVYTFQKQYYHLRCMNDSVEINQFFI